MDEQREALKSLRQWAETERAFGCVEMPRLVGVEKTASVADPNADDKTARLARLEQEVNACMACPLGTTRTRFVFGDGSANAQLMFIGEAPGYDEDQQGKPFVGAAGMLLTKIIEAMKLQRKDVYIANCLKCRPPGNRNPLPSEIACCAPILARQIEIIQPKIICALGKFAAQTLLKTEEPISRLRGRFFDYGGIPLMPTFHPAYLLRNPSDKKLVWADMQLIMKKLGLL